MSLFESDSLENQKLVPTQNECDIRLKKAMDMINKLDFSAFKYEESDPIKYNRKEVISTYRSKFLSPPKKRNHEARSNINRDEVIEAKHKETQDDVPEEKNSKEEKTKKEDA